MTRRHRKSRNFALIGILFLFSVSVIGNVDSRLHIGGNYWEDSSFDSGIEAVDHSEVVPVVDLPERVEDSGDIQASKAREVFGINVEARVFDSGVLDDSATLLDTKAAPAEQSLEDSDVESKVVESVAIVEDEVVEEAVSAAEAIEPKPEPVVVAVIEEVVEAPPVHEAPAPEPEPEPEKPAILLHTVRSGETLWDIANSYGISVDTILSANDIANSNRIQVGQELKVLTVRGVLHTVSVGESLWEIAQRYKISMDEIVTANSISNPSRIQPATQIVIPGATQIRPRDVLVVNGQLQRAFAWPLRGRLSSPFGPRWGTMHNGIDLAVPTGTPVKAASEGRVTFSGYNGGYGYLVIIDHGNGVETRYAHHSRNIVQVGQRVDRGQTIAYSGNTGNSTGPHLHFEIRHRGAPVDPQRFLR